jgi:hypothetical protein
MKKLFNPYKSYLIKFLNLKIKKNNEKSNIINKNIFNSI